MDDNSKPPRAKPGRKKGGGRTTDARVNELAIMIASGQYVTHVSAVALAEEWKVAPSTVEKYACEAARRVRNKVFDNEVLVARATANLEYITSLAITGAAVKPELLRTAVEAIRLTMAIVRETKETGGGAQPVQHVVITQEHPLEEREPEPGPAAAVAVEPDPEPELAAGDGARAEGAPVSPPAPSADARLPWAPTRK